MSDFDPTDIDRINQFEAFGMPGKNAPDPNRKAHLEFLHRRRQSREKPATLKADGESYGEMVLSIPEQDFAIIMARFPDMNSTDPETQRRAIEAFLKDPRSEPYRVDASVGRKRRDGRRVTNNGVV